MANQNGNAQTLRSRIMQWFDVLFIMVLCFVTLLATMLLRGKVLVGSGESGGLDYSFSLITFGLVVAIFVAYLWYMLSHSDRELKEMVNHVYGEEPKSDAPEAEPDARR